MRYGKSFYFIKNGFKSLNKINEKESEFTDSFLIKNFEFLFT